MVSRLCLTGPLLRWTQGTTEPFLDANGRSLPGSISQKLFVPINGVQQGMIIRGKHASKRQQTGRLVHRSALDQLQGPARRGRGVRVCDPLAVQ